MRTLLALLLILVGLPAHGQPAARALEIGVVPTLPTGKLLESYQPMAAHFARALNRPVQIVTAPDIGSFQKRTLQGAYDFVLSGPLQGWHASADADYQILLQSSRPVQAVVLVRRDSGITSLAQLKKKPVASMESTTLIAQLGAEMLRKAGARGDQAADMRYERSPNNAVQSMLHGDVVAAIVTANLMKVLPPEDLDRLRSIAESARYPGMLFMSRRGGDRPAPDAWKRALLDFAAAESGRNTITELHGGLEAPALNELKRLAPLLAEQRKLLAE